MEDKIKPEILMDIRKLDVEEGKREYHHYFDSLLQARDELFEKKLRDGLEKHMDYLNMLKK